MCVYNKWALSVVVLLMVKAPLAEEDSHKKSFLWETALPTLVIAISRRESSLATRVVVARHQRCPARCQ